MALARAAVWPSRQHRTLRSAPVAAAVVDVELRPVSPFDLARSARFQGCGTRAFREGVLRLRFAAAGEPAAAAVHQRPDGSLVARIEAADETAAVDHLRFALGTGRRPPPLPGARRARRAARPLLRNLRGCECCGSRPWRTPRCGLRRAADHVGRGPADRAPNHRGVGAAGADDLRLPPDGAALGALSPPGWRPAGWPADGRRAGAALPHARPRPPARPPDGRRRAPADPRAAPRPVERGRDLPAGAGRHDHGLVGDLGLIRLYERLHGVRRRPRRTRRRCSAVGRVAGLASVYLLHHPLTRRRGPVDGS